jgi:multidrug efflux pump subunit AcrA (membrane-fusion protein)
MPFTRRAIAIGGAVVVLAAVAAGVFAFRERLWPGADHTAMNHAPAAASPAPATPAGVVPRGGVTVEPERQQLIGVRLATATREPMAAVVRTTGVVRYDETRQADINVKLDGWVRELYVDYTGQLVQNGQPLFSLYSPDLLVAQNEYLLALKTRDQLKESAIADAREYAGRVVEAARQRLALWDVTPEDIAAIENARAPKEAVTFRSPASGYVLEKQVVRGMHITPGQSLYRIADLSVVWVEAYMFDNEIVFFRVCLV